MHEALPPSALSFPERHRVEPISQMVAPEDVPNRLRPLSKKQPTDAQPSGPLYFSGAAGQLFVPDCGLPKIQSELERRGIQEPTWQSADGNWCAVRTENGGYVWYSVEIEGNLDLVGVAEMILNNALARQGISRQLNFSNASDSSHLRNFMRDRLIVFRVGLLSSFLGLEPDVYNGDRVAGFEVAGSPDTLASNWRVSTVYEGLVAVPPELMSEDFPNWPLSFGDVSIIADQQEHVVPISVTLAELQHVIRQCLTPCSGSAASEAPILVPATTSADATLPESQTTEPAKNNTGVLSPQEQVAQAGWFVIVIFGTVIGVIVVAGGGVTLAVASLNRLANGAPKKTAFLTIRTPSTTAGEPDKVTVVTVTGTSSQIKLAKSQASRHSEVFYLEDGGPEDGYLPYVDSPEAVAFKGIMQRTGSQYTWDVTMSAGEADVDTVIRGVTCDYGTGLLFVESRAVQSGGKLGFFSGRVAIKPQVRVITLREAEQLLLDPTIRRANEGHFTDKRFSDSGQEKFDKIFARQKEKRQSDPYLSPEEKVLRDNMF